MEQMKPHVLAIDDDNGTLRTLSAVLRPLCTIRPFSSGMGALSYLERHPADLILLDTKMPGMSGFHVLRSLRENPSTSAIPVIALTSDQEQGHEADVLQMGAADYILKPIRPWVLLSRVRLQIELLRHKRHLESMVLEKSQRLSLINEKLKAREEVTLSLLAKVTDLRDHETGNHINRTTEFVRVIAEDLLCAPTKGYRLSTAEVDDIARSARLHDLGKIAVPDYILNKPGPLSPAEFSIIKMHPVHGEALLREYIGESNEDSFLQTACDIAYAHHEWWDGGGYPCGVAGPKIPLSARIVALADVYDALTSTRPYKPALSHDTALGLIERNRGTQFDPVLTDLFLKHSAVLPRISKKFS